MAKNPSIGHVNCHVCGFADCEVKHDKNGRAYVFCPDCNIQSFTRNQSQSDKLKSRMRPVAVTEKAAITEPKNTVTVTEKITPPPVKSGGFSLGDL